ncbi:MAG: MBL fold metallo-hydrolase [bacterium]
MQITWHGLNCVRLQIKDVTILIDPLAPTVGVSAPRMQADLFVFSSTENPQYGKALKSGVFTIAAPGEYEVRGVVINGIAINQPGGHPLTIYTFEAEGMVLGHLGALGVAINGPQVEKLKDIDALLIPVGGKPVLSAKQATELLSVLEPRVVLPIYYRIPGLSLRLDGVEPFLKELGVKNVEPQEKIRLVKKELPEEEMRVLLLKA